MAAGDGADIFMFLQKTKSKLSMVPGECQTELRVPGRPTNDLLNGFQKPYMFEISKFDFGVGASQETVEAYENVGKTPVPGAKPPPRRRPKSLPGQTLDETPVTIQAVSFNRLMDRASPLLLQATIERTYFERVAIVKRKSAGGISAGDAYLRMDFEGVILIEASWSNDDPIEESYSFHARAITMRYKPQLPDGTLGAAKVGFWSMVPDAKEAKL